MSTQLPFFMSGPRMVIKMDGKVLAFAIGLDITVSRNIQTVYQFGQVGPIANQATLYNGVTGSMQIVKLIDSAVVTDKESVAALTQGVGAIKPTGNVSLPITVNAASGTSNSTTANSTTANSALSISSNMQKQLDPEQVLLSSTFDIEVWQSYPTSTTSTTQKAVKHFTIQNCRLNSRGTTISPGSLTSESVGFVGTLFVTEQRQAVSGVSDDNLRDLEDSSTQEG